MKSGIYIITNISNGKQYVGSTKSLSARWSDHRYWLRSKKHKNRHLQNAWGQYGEHAFTFSVVEYCSPEELTMRETWWLELLGTTSREKGYNIRLPDERTISDETRRRMSLAHIGKPMSAETRRNMSKPKTREHAANIAKARLGMKFSDEHRANISKNNGMRKR